MSAPFRIGRQEEEGATNPSGLCGNRMQEMFIDIGTPAQIGWSSNIGSTFPMQHSYPPHSTALPVAAVGGGGNRLQRHIRNAMRPLLRWQCCDHR